MKTMPNLKQHLQDTKNDLQELEELWEIKNIRTNER